MKFKRHLKKETSPNNLQSVKEPEKEVHYTQGHLTNLLISTHMHFVTQNWKQKHQKLQRAVLFRKNANPRFKKKKKKQFLNKRKLEKKWDKETKKFWGSLTGHSVPVSNKSCIKFQRFDLSKKGERNLETSEAKIEISKKTLQRNSYKEKEKQKRLKFRRAKDMTKRLSLTHSRVNWKTNSRNWTKKCTKKNCWHIIIYLYKKKKNVTASIWEKSIPR